LTRLDPNTPTVSPSASTWHSSNHPNPPSWSTPDSTTRTRHGASGSHPNGSSVAHPASLRALQALGESRESITRIAITHAHFDHVAGLTSEAGPGGDPTPRFPNATVFLHRADAERVLAATEDPSSADMAGRLTTIRDHGMLHVVDGDHEIAPGVTMLHTGGESAGHSVIQLHTDDSTFLALGDLFHYPFELEHPEWMPPWANRAAMTAARTRFMNVAADSRAVVMFTHHPFAPWGKIERQSGGFRWHRLANAGLT
jgi:glyoxylase-like metal-dependent hydrolase (beta-lactamase superfamily II)